MIVENIIGSLKTDNFGDAVIEYVDIDWYNANKKLHKFKLEDGTIIATRLTHEAMTRGLLQDDVLTKIDDKIIVINIKEVNCIAVLLDDILKASKVSYEIGNRHGSLFVSEDNYLIVPYDKPTFEFLDNLGVSPIEKTTKIHSDRAISNFGNSHEHGHSHGHSHSHSH